MTNVEQMLKDMTPETFANLGEGDVVYIKPVTRHGESNFALYAATGRELAVFDSWETALTTALQNNMHAAYLH